MKVHGHPISVATRHVFMMLAEKGQTATLAKVDVFHDEQSSPQHRERHPFGHIPVLEDGEFRLYETPAILRHIERRWPAPSLMPGDPHDCALADQWHCIEQAYLQPAMQKLIARQGAKQFGRPDPGPAIVVEGRKELAMIFSVLARHLRDRTFIGGPRFSLPDLVWLAYFPYIEEAGAGDLVGAQPTLSSWWHRVKDRPSLATALGQL